MSNRHFDYESHLKYHMPAFFRFRSLPTKGDMRESRRVVSFSLQKVQTDNAKKYRNPTKNALYPTVNALNTQPSHKDFINLLNFPYQSAGVITLLINRKENPMLITFIDGVYNVSAESKDSTELIKEMSLAINMLAEEADGDYKPPTFDNKGEARTLVRCEVGTSI